MSELIRLCCRKCRAENVELKSRLGNSVTDLYVGLKRDKMTLITAEKVIMEEFNYKMVGAVDRRLSITTGDLIIEGNNLIVSKGKDGASTLLQGPSVSISANKLSGSGKLEVNTEGSSYKSGDLR